MDRSVAFIGDNQQHIYFTALEKTSTAAARAILAAGVSANLSLVGDNEKLRRRVTRIMLLAISIAVHQELMPGTCGGAVKLMPGSLLTELWMTPVVTTWLPIVPAVTPAADNVGSLLMASAMALAT